MAKLVYKTHSEVKKQTSAFLHSKKASNKWLIKELQKVRKLKTKQLKWSIAINAILLAYVIIEGIYG
jgi:hypothetical protein